MAELLLELGCEELPASFVRKAYSDLRDKVAQILLDSKLGTGSNVEAIGTPRRLIISATGLKERQSDETKEVRGPALKAAFDSEGNPSNALLGFCRSNGITPESLRKDEQYVWAAKTIHGRSASEVLAELLPLAIRSLTFDKTMRWGSSRMRFARPIRWILASLDGNVIPFEIEGVVAGLESRGHRFYSPSPFVAGSLNELLEGLRARNVEPDPEVRRKTIIEGARAVAVGIPDLSDALIEENVFLTEWPTSIRGEFRTDFMVLPEPVLVTAMAKHEKMFPVRDDHGKITNSFVFVRNSGEDATVRKGSEWVLNARFNDAKFFFDEDLKFSMKDFLERTSGILFQEKLGTVRSRADRLARLAESIANLTGARSDEQTYAHQAGLYAKADLSCGLVSELSSLQGVIGGEYARREGFAGAIAWALETQYDPSKNTDPRSCSGERTSLRLVMADALDKLAGYLGLGLEPTGSSDPYGLRRAVTLLIEAAWAWPDSLPSFDELLDVALDGYRMQDIALDAEAAHRSAQAIFRSRYSALLPEVRYDILEAAILPAIPFEATSPRRVKLRASVLEELASDVAFVQTATRPIKILDSARRNGFEFGVENSLSRLEHSALESADGLALFQTLTDQDTALNAAVVAENATEVTRLVRNLAAPINRFFEETMVMADQPEVRYARLTLMNAVIEQLFAAGDFTRIVIEG
jgi:glycyl-tRNA synthetase beta chain